jgi:hypothetical protein
MWKTIRFVSGLKQTPYLRLESLTALAASEARSNTPTIGFVTVPTSPFPKPEIKPYKKRYTMSLQQL